MTTLDATEVHPSWCSRNHCFDIPGTAMHSTPQITRGHSLAAVFEEIRWTGGRTTALPLTIEAYFKADSIGEPMSVYECRDLIAVLTEAADRLDLLRGDTEPCWSCVSGLGCSLHGQAAS